MSLSVGAPPGGSTPSPSPPPLPCQTWCETNTRDWETKCGWPNNCGGCTACYTPPPSPPSPTPSAPAPAPDGLQSCVCGSSPTEYATFNDQLNCFAASDITNLEVMYSGMSVSQAVATFYGVCADYDNDGTVRANDLTNMKCAPLFDYQSHLLYSANDSRSTMRPLLLFPRQNKIRIS
eukprot:56435-Prymnesium_polylepis.1